MKKTLTLALILLLLAGCNSASVEQPGEGYAPETIISAADNTDSPAEAETSGSTSIQANGEIPGAEPEENGNNILIAYFSVQETSGVDAVSGASRVVVVEEVVGNTQLIAQWISQEVQGDLFEIRTVQTYPGEHDKLLDFANNELAACARPELAAVIENPGQYDIIFVGYPNWWADMPMPLYTFFDTYDFSGKTIIPFTTHGGSRFANTVRSIEALAPDAVVIQDG